MAEDVVKAMEVFWTREDETEIEDPLVYVKGLSCYDNGNRQPRKSSHAARHKTYQTGIKVSPKSKTSGQKSSTKSSAKSRPLVKQKQSEDTSQLKTSNLQTKKVTLRDLRPEDKKRVANLIQELARIGEEKENVVEQLYSQRQEYDHYIRNLLDQQEMIVKERERVMKQLYDCQVMLSKYQKVITEDRGKHNVKKAKKEKERKDFDFNPKPMPTSVDSIQMDSKASSPERKSSVEKSSNAEEYEITPGDTRRRTGLPSAETGSRPFTNMIDQLIEQEKSSMGSPASSIRPSSINSMSSKSSNIENVMGKNRTGKNGEIAKGKLFGIGPLPAPILSSTHTSDLVSNATNSPSIQQQSRTRAQDFAPLSMDATETMSVKSNDAYPIPAKENDGTRSGFRTPTKSKHERLIAEKECLLKEQKKLGEIIAEQQKYLGEPLYTDTSTPVNTSENKVTFNSPVVCELSESSHKEMLKYYSELSPGTRQKELNSQKEALLLEQERLKEILAEQEKLLKTKQEQLHHQQELQRHRLEFFQETGYFPTSRGTNSHISTSSGSRRLEYTLPQSTCSTVTNSSQNTNDSYYLNYFPSHQPALDVRSETVGSNFSNTKPRSLIETQSEDISPRLDLFEVENQLLSESMENLRLLTKHCFDVPEAALQAGKKKVLGKESRRPEASVASKELLDRNKFMLKSTQKNTSPLVLSSEPLQLLADIIDEVESIQNQSNNSPGSRDTQSMHSSHSATGALNNAALSELLNDAARQSNDTHDSQAVLEESQLLEDVFFVHK